MLHECTTYFKLDHSTSIISSSLMSVDTPNTSSPQVFFQKHLVYPGPFLTPSPALNSPILLSLPISTVASEDNSCGLSKSCPFPCISTGIDFIGMKCPPSSAPNSDFELSPPAFNNCAPACLLALFLLHRRQNAMAAAPKPNKSPSATPTPIPIFAALLNPPEGPGAGVLVVGSVGTVVEF